MVGRRPVWAAACVAVLATVNVFAAVEAQDSTFRGDLRHSGFYQGTAPETAPVVRWKFQTGAPVRSTPAVAYGNLFIGTGLGAFHCLDLATGRALWTVHLGGPVAAAAAVSGGTVYVPARDGVLYALDARSGAQRWATPRSVERPFDGGWDYWTASPVVAGDVVLYAGGDGFLRALDAKTGQERWKFDGIARLRATPAVDGNTVYVAGMNGALTALNLRNGQSRWTFTAKGNPSFPNGELQASPVVAGSLVLVGSRDYRLYALETETGKLRWEAEHKDSWIVSSPAVVDGNVYVGSSDAKFFEALELETGRSLWRTPLKGNVFSSPAVAGTLVVFGGWDGAVHALDRASGSVRWSFATGAEIQSSPVIDNGVVYVGSDDGFVYALGAAAPHPDQRPLERVVYWDAAAPSWFVDHEKLRDALAGDGYRVVDSAGLAAFLEQRTKDQARSVVVFAKDSVPEAVGPAGLRRYLDAGGKVVWVGILPAALKLDPSGNYALDPTLAPAATGVDHQGANNDNHGIRVSPVGAAWGLSTDWIGGWSVPAAPSLSVLAYDELGRAAAWVQGYGWPLGTGFVRLWGTRTIPGDLRQVKTAAEYMVK